MSDTPQHWKERKQRRLNQAIEALEREDAAAKKRPRFHGVYVPPKIAKIQRYLAGLGYRQRQKAGVRVQSSDLTSEL
jgi:hypothetical protein